MRVSVRFSWQAYLLDTLRMALRCLLFIRVAILLRNIRSHTRAHTHTHAHSHRQQLSHTHTHPRAFRQIHSLHLHTRVCARNTYSLAHTRATHIQDRFAAPAASGWADVVVHFAFDADDNRHVVEIRLVHQDLALVAEEHSAAGPHLKTRSARELLMA